MYLKKIAVLHVIYVLLRYSLLGTRCRREDQTAKVVSTNFGHCLPRSSDSESKFLLNLYTRLCTARIMYNGLLNRGICTI